MSDRNPIEKIESCDFVCEAGTLVNNTDWKHVKAELDHLRAELEAANRLLDDARAQEPVAYLHNKRVDVIHTSVKSLLSDFAVNSGPESMLRPIDKAEHYTIPLYAAPVPAQPAAAKVNPYREGTHEHEAYAIGANGVKGSFSNHALLCELLPVLDEVMAGGVAEDLLSRLDGGQSINTVEGKAWLKLRAILSATDTEGRKDAG